jgi:hypothetical protein
MIAVADYRARQTEATIVIRMLPPREVSPNGGWTWRQRREAKAEFRGEAAKATLYDSEGVTAFADRFEPVTIDAEIAWCCGRKRMDDDNAKACLKSAIDGISDVLWRGQDRHVTLGEVKQTRGDGMVIVTLKGVE